MKNAWGDPGWKEDDSTSSLSNLAMRACHVTVLAHEFACCGDVVFGLSSCIMNHAMRMTCINESGHACIIQNMSIAKPLLALVDTLPALLEHIGARCHDSYPSDWQVKLYCDSLSKGSYKNNNQNVDSSGKKMHIKNGVAFTHGNPYKHDCCQHLRLVVNCHAQRLNVKTAYIYTAKFLCHVKYMNACCIGGMFHTSGQAGFCWISPLVWSLSQNELALMEYWMRMVYSFKGWGRGQGAWDMVKATGMSKWDRPRSKEAQESQKGHEGKKKDAAHKKPAAKKSKK